MFLWGRDSKTKSLRRYEFGERAECCIESPKSGTHTWRMWWEIWRREMAQQRLRSSSAQPWHAPCKHLEALKNPKTWPLPPGANIITWAVRSRHSKGLCWADSQCHRQEDARPCRAPFPSPPLYWVTVTKSSALWS